MSDSADCASATVTQKSRSNDAPRSLARRPKSSDSFFRATTFSPASTAESRASSIPTDAAVATIRWSSSRKSADSSAPYRRLAGRRTARLGQLTQLHLALGGVVQPAQQRDRRADLGPERGRFPGFDCRDLPRAPLRCQHRQQTPRTARPFRVSPAAACSLLRATAQFAATLSQKKPSYAGND